MLSALLLNFIQASCTAHLADKIPELPPTGDLLADYVRITVPFYYFQAQFIALCNQNLAISGQMASFCVNHIISRLRGSTDRIETPKRKAVAANGIGEVSSKAILEKILVDALTVLGTIDWPGADILLLTFSRIMVCTFINIPHCRWTRLIQ